MNDIITAAAVALTITVISLIPNPRAKALIAGLPIPITLLLIGTSGNVGISHLFGLFLVIGFLWVVYWLHALKKVPILLSTFVAVVLYVVCGMILAPAKGLWFWAGVLTLLVLWFCFVKFVYRQPKETNQKPIKHRFSNKIFYPFQALLIFIIVLILLPLTHLLAGAVITFPLSTLFAVVVMRTQLQTLANELSRNSIGLLAFFVTVFLLEHTIGLISAVITGWIVCLACLIFLQPKLFFPNRTITPRFKPQS